ncbi:MAG: nuclear transport factor 2 family protein [Armatimonadota bacterium]|nr:nuclear transport factor 2 family protein [Armatimonadota bacterium]
MKSEVDKESEAALTRAYERWLKAWRNVDVELMLSLFDRDNPGLIYQAEETAGPAHTITDLTAYWTAARDQLHLQVKQWQELEKHVWISDDIATIYVLLDTTLAAELMAPGDISGKLRASILYRRVGAEWRIIHYHESRQMLVENEGGVYRFLTDARLAKKN